MLVEFPEIELGGKRMTYRKGDQVVLAVKGAGVTSYEDYTVAYIKKGEVWLDNGPGNDPSGPFNQDGEYLGDSMFGFGFVLLPPSREGSDHESRT